MGWFNGKDSPLFCTTFSLATLALFLGHCGDVPRRPNVLLISLDTLRADHLGCYGYSRKTSPFWDKLAAQGTRYSNAIVNTHGTPSSHATLFSSLYQETHRVGHNGLKPPEPSQNRVPETLEMLPEILLAAGYLTLGVSDGVWVSSEMGFDQGFVEFHDEDWAGAASRAGDLVELVDRHQDDNRPIFAFYHTYEIHAPYSPPEKYKTLFGTYKSNFVPSSQNLIDGYKDGLKLSVDDLRLVRARYDGGIRFTDDTLGEMFDQLEALGFLDNCLVVVTADHGEALGEKNLLFHPAVLYRELLQVPFIINGPSVPKGRVDSRLASTIDIAPTILSYVGIPVTQRMEGSDLLARPKPKEEQRVFTQYSSVRYGIQTADWKLIETNKTLLIELFDLRADPAEERNVASKFPGVVRELRERLAEWKSNQTDHVISDRGEVELSDDRIEKLKSLGYLQ